MVVVVVVVVRGEVHRDEALRPGSPSLSECCLSHSLFPHMPQPCGCPVPLPPAPLPLAPRHTSLREASR